MHLRQRAILAGGAVLALTIGVGAGLLAVAPVNNAMAHAPSLMAKAEILPAAEAPAPAPTAPPEPAPIAVAAYAEPASVPRTQRPQYAQQAGRDDPAAIAWPDERAAPAPVDEPQRDEAEGPRDVTYPPSPPPYAQPYDGPPTYGPGWW